MGETVRITAHDGGDFSGYLARPPGDRAPGIVLIQEIFGVSAFMRATADRYASLGFAVLSPDLYWRQKPGVELSDRTEAEWNEARALGKSMDEGLALEDLRSAVDRLRSAPGADGRVGCVGYCMGGRLAFLMAARQSSDCAVGYYAVGIETRLAQAGPIRAPLMLHIAGRDAWCPVSAQRKIHEALDGNALATLHDYPEADHAFARAGGKNHDPAAAELADLRSLAFLDRNLRGGKPR